MWNIIDETLSVTPDSIEAVKEVIEEGGTFIHMKSGKHFGPLPMTHEEVMANIGTGSIWPYIPKEKIPVLRMVRLTAENDAAILAFMQDTECPFEMVGDHTCVIHMVDRDLIALKNNYLFYLGDREFGSCASEYFHKRYEMI